MKEAISTPPAPDSAAGAGAGGAGSAHSASSVEDTAMFEEPVSFSTLLFYSCTKSCWNELHSKVPADRIGHRVEHVEWMPDPDDQSPNKPR